MNNNKILNTKIASLESQLDLFETEIHYLNKLLIKCGFTEGLKTLKETANEHILESDPTKIFSPKKNSRDNNYFDHE